METVPIVPWSDRKTRHRGELSYDERNDGFCVYCGGDPTSREHVPSRVLLDTPFPPDLAVVEACRECNESFSKDEAYVAAVLACVLAGSTDPAQIERETARRILSSSPALRIMIKDAMVSDETGTRTQIDIDRVSRVLAKLAVGHLKYETGEVYSLTDAIVSFCPSELMSQAAIEEFEQVQPSALLPDVGSRALIDLLQTTVGSDLWESWWELQPQRYRYLVRTGPPLEVRLVIQEYLAVKVVFD